MSNCRFGINILNYKLVLSIILILFVTPEYFAQQQEKKIIHPLMGVITISLEAGATFGHTDYSNSGTGFIWRGSAEYFLPTYTNHLVSLKIFYGMGNIQGSDPGYTPTRFITDIRFLGTGISYGYRVREKLFPTIFVGLSYLSFDPKDEKGEQLQSNRDGIYSNNDVNLNTEIGLKYLISDEFTLNISVGVAFNFNDWLDDIEKNGDNDIFYIAFLGLTYNLFPKKDEDDDGVEDSKDLCSATPEGVQVDINGCPFDQDRDSVPDYLDRCPDTRARVKVDSNGCPVDSDRDGIPDYFDRCPGTPLNVTVSRFGCPLDSDDDRVPDYLDRCPRTPKEIRVDIFGCPVDSDGDKVPDFQDKCPHTTPGIQVDNSGCPLDSDKDGVADYLDKCPNTPVGNSVTIDGCSDEFQEYIFDASTTFKNEEAILSPNAYDELDKVVARIKLRPNSNWRIEGHTDNNGESEYNKVLSFHRAQAVFNYFIFKGLNKNNFEVVGLGEDVPIADNSTSAGRQANRRVVLIRIG